MRTIILALITCSLLACSQKKNITSKDNITTPVKKETKKMTEEKFDNDCYSDRGMRTKAVDQEATMVKVMNSFMFTFENTRWQPCSVPEAFQVEGKKVLVSGEVLEIRPNERRAGTPFNITKLTSK